jgi:transposase
LRYQLLSAADAQKVLGIPSATVRSWFARKDRTGLYSRGLDRRGNPLFWRQDLEKLRRGERIR